MADAKICDRCGKYYRENMVQTTVARMKKAKHLDGVVLYNDKDYPIDESMMDLCHECISTLISWLRMDDTRKEDEQNVLD